MQIAMEVSYPRTWSCPEPATSPHADACTRIVLQWFRDLGLDSAENGTKLQKMNIVEYGGASCPRASFVVTLHYFMLVTLWLLWDDWVERLDLGAPRTKHMERMLKLFSKPWRDLVVPHPILPKEPGSYIVVPESRRKVKPRDVADAFSQFEFAWRQVLQGVLEIALNRALVTNGPQEIDAFYARFVGSLFAWTQTADREASLFHRLRVDPSLIFRLHAHEDPRPRSPRATRTAPELVDAGREVPWQEALHLLQEMRITSIGFFCCAQLLELAGGRILSQDAWQSDWHQQTMHAAGALIASDNEIVSLAKDAAEGWGNVLLCSQKLRPGTPWLQLVEESSAAHRRFVATLDAACAQMIAAHTDDADKRNHLRATYDAFRWNVTGFARWHCNRATGRYNDKFLVVNGTTFVPTLRLDTCPEPTTR